MFVNCAQNQETNVEFSQWQSPERPQENLPWLKDLIKKADNDKTGNYIGCIWLENYKGRDFFITNMMLGSGGTMYWVFDCLGNHIAYSKGGNENNCPACKFVGHKHFSIEPGELPEIFELKLDIVVYSTQGLSCIKSLEQ